MKNLIISSMFFATLVTSVYGQEIPIVNLQTQLQENTQQYTSAILENEIQGIYVEHVALTSKNGIVDSFKDGYKTIFLFVKGKGTVVAADSIYDIIPETILLPQSLKNITINTAKNDTLQYLRISSKLTAQDLLDLNDFPDANTQNVYYAKFIDCKSYTEPIKSPNTVSRTILPNKYIPRIAMGTVQTTGPDRVGNHEHPMLEQLFLGLTDNNSVVYADEAQVNFPEYSVLHIPLGSSHAVSVEKDEVMYYVWMDFFRDKKGEEWLKTHNTDDDK
ncbi:cupin domain-containing protein [uncultured Polaribacter sp.]|uniref:cupin domain-containing protein n=1 Tax=uncultured Polaribacter sp. TaxID=174711 RepID=UPI0030DD0D69